MVGKFNSIGHVPCFHWTGAQYVELIKHHANSFDADRHDICQKIYATAVWEARILRKKCVNRNIIQFATKERKCFKMA